VRAKRKIKEDAQLVEVARAGHFEVVDPRAGAWKDVERVVGEAVRSLPVDSTQSSVDGCPSL